MTQQQFGIIGLGVMGQNLALNMERNGVHLVGYDRSATVRDKFAATAAAIETLAQVVNVRMSYQYEVRRHSVLDNQPPSPWLKRWLAETQERRLSSEPSWRGTLKRTK